MKNSLNEQISKVDNLLNINAELDAALRSNKEDTSYIIGELGEIYSDLADAKKDIDKLQKEILAIRRQDSRAWIGAALLAGGNGGGTGVLVSGCYTQDADQIICGISTIVITDIVWLIGHYGLKWF